MSHRLPAGGARRATRATAALPNDVIAELRRSSRPGRDEQAISRLERAVALLQRDDASGAVTEALKAKDFAPRSGAVREVLGLALYGRERYREALAEMQAYRRMTGRLDQNHIIADCFRAVGQPERAIPLAEEALAGQKVPLAARVEVVVVAASALADMRRFDQALGMLRRIRTSEDVGGPETIRVWYVTGDIMERAGRRDEAEREFRKIMRHDPSAYDVAERLAALGGSAPPRRRSSR
ncbi:MAG: tetratricopeptide repeat protein [Actinomycetota bacterium]